MIHPSGIVVEWLQRLHEIELEIQSTLQLNRENLSQPSQDDLESVMGELRSVQATLTDLAIAEGCLEEQQEDQ